MDDFAAGRPEAVLRHGNEWFVASEAAPDLIAEANRRGVKVLGLEGFLIDGDATYPALSRIADFSNDPPEVASRRALCQSPLLVVQGRPLVNSLTFQPTLVWFAPMSVTEMTAGTSPLLDQRWRVPFWM